MATLQDPQTFDPEYVPRSPRFPATDDHGLRITIRYRDALREARLINVSRHGLQLATGEPVSVAQPLDILARGALSGDSELDLEIRALVCWRKQTASGWLVGCEMEEPLDWEIMGELFLGDILATG